jgi:hypothetical protein
MKLCFRVFHSSRVNITHNGMITLLLLIVELEVAVTRWLIMQDRDLYQQRFDKCLNFGGDYAEKYSDSSTVKSDLFLVELKTNNPHMCIVHVYFFFCLTVHFDVL